MADVVRWVDTQEVGEVAGILERAGPPEALDAARATWCRDERTRSSVYTTAETVLAPFAHLPAGADRCAAGPRSSPSSSSAGPTRCTCARRHTTSDDCAGYFTASTQQVLAHAFASGHAVGAPTRPAVAGGARRGGAHRAAARARRPGGDVRVPRDPAGHGLAGPGAGAGPVRRAGADGAEQPPGQALPPGHRRPRHARLRQPADRRRGGHPTLRHPGPVGAPLDHRDDGAAPAVAARGAALPAAGSGRPGLRDAAPGAARSCARGGATVRRLRLDAGPDR